MWAIWFGAELTNSIDIDIDIFTEHVIFRYDDSNCHVIVKPVLEGVSSPGTDTKNYLQLKLPYFSWPDSPCQNCYYTFTFHRISFWCLSFWTSYLKDVCYVETLFCNFIICILLAYLQEKTWKSINTYIFHNFNILLEIKHVGRLLWLDEWSC